MECKFQELVTFFRPFMLANVRARYSAFAYLQRLKESPPFPHFHLLHQSLDMSPQGPSPSDVLWNWEVTRRG